jgi:hypothetical protein
MRNGPRANQASAADHDCLHGLLSFVGRWTTLIIFSMHRDGRHTVLFPERPA